MLSVASTSALVAGSVPSKSMALKIQVIRPFMLKGKVQTVGAVLEVASSFAHEIVSIGRAAYFKEPPPVAAEPEAEPTNRKKGK